MRKLKNNLLLILLFCVIVGCSSSPRHLGDPPVESSWNEQLKQKLPLLGHRNWILVVDKAYPAPASKNILVIDTKKQLPEVLDTVLAQLSKQAHLRPIFYADKELDYLDEGIAPGLKTYKENLAKLLANVKVNPLLHDEVFGKMDKAAQLFEVIVLKTESLLPYSSVFIELDCKYWDADREKILRDRMGHYK